ncbi:MAG: (E)-4-hydroxy-3-methylbut-2-enyl-diphosphate synthase [Bacteroidales bacterium]
MSLFNYQSRVIQIGDLPVGGHYPIRIQSMTSTPTMDTQATVEQSIRMIEAGCEYVRITAQGVKEAEHLAVIKKELRKRGYTTPLIADIHYQPKAAEIAAQCVEKVRINPGNYIDRNKGKAEYTESEFQAEVEKIRDRIKPLLRICKQYGTALRIGSNHGSLSERILSRYGDTPLGMVESALEFVRICEDLSFYNIVLSMKASSVKVMVQANRLLAKKMMEEERNYPIHLGVTEAGDGEDGRIKSAAGIGPLLEDGIGDTFRVSLTEDPEYEIPVALSITKKFNQTKERTKASSPVVQSPGFNPFSFTKRKTIRQGLIGNSQPPVVIVNSQSFIKKDRKTGILPDYISTAKNILIIPDGSMVGPEVVSFDATNDNENILNDVCDSVLVLDTNVDLPIHESRKTISGLIEKKSQIPIILKRNFKGLSKEDLVLKAASDCSFLLIDGLIDGIWLESETVDLQSISEISFGILQASGSRITKTEYIACPSCGRTLFNIQQALSKIKERTNHLKGIKIAVMGCIVNGPGEMADADFGYVGAGPGKINLYKGKLVVKKNVNEDMAVDELIDLIKSHGQWIDK